METSKTPLLKKVNHNQLLFGCIIILLSLIILYFLTRYYIESETQESLNNTNHRIEQLLVNNKSVISLSPLFEIEETLIAKPSFTKDTLIFDELQKENELFRELNTYKTINGKNYHIVVRELIVEYDDTLFSIIFSFTIIISLVYLSQYYYGKYLNKMIWKPFFKNLKTIKTFSIHSNKPIELHPSDILEFSELNQVIENLSAKIILDYQNLKQFNEDISHEVQTPLSIIQAKIENLINDYKPLDETHLLALNDIQKNTTRLSKLNKGLILLTKIDNYQYNEFETVDINSIISALLEDFEDIAVIKSLIVSYKPLQTIQLKMDTVLAEILCSNLIANALKYTPQTGQIAIVLKNDSIIIKNDGNQAIVNPEQLFNRFYKENKQSQSLGLGMAIVKKICDYYEYHIAYGYVGSQHVFTIKLIPN